MKNSILFVVLGVLILGFAGCGDQESMTAAVAITGTSLDKDAPAISGPRVIRSAEDYWVWYYDEPRDITVIIGVDPIYAQDTGDWTLDSVEVQTVTNPVDQDIVNRTMHGHDLTVSVFSGLPIYWVDFYTLECLATGTCDLTATDNDYYAWANDAHRVNAWGFEAHGALTTPQGETRHLNAVWRARWPGGDSTESYWMVGDVHLSPAH